MLAPGVNEELQQRERFRLKDLDRRQLQTRRYPVQHGQDRIPPRDQTRTEVDHGLSIVIRRLFNITGTNTPSTPTVHLIQGRQFWGCLRPRPDFKISHPLRR